jgi:hypothetical protein
MYLYYAWYILIKEGRENKEGKNNKEGMEVMEKGKRLIFKVLRKFPLYTQDPN